MTSGNDETWMRLAIEEGELARGTTGDNPWVGCVIVSAGGELSGRGHTLGPGEDHAEIAASRDAQARGHSVVGATLYSTLEPCSFHGRTPACSKSIAERGVARVVIGMRDPHPRVDGEGILILRNAGVEVVEGVCEADVRRQLGPWVIAQHPQEALRRAQALPEVERVSKLAELYGVEPARIQGLFVEELPNFRKFDARAAFRTAVYILWSLVVLFTLHAVGLVLLLLAREARRYWYRRRLRSVVAQVRHDYLTEPGRAETRERLRGSALGQALVFELFALGVSALLMVGWYFWGPLGYP